MALPDAWTSGASRLRAHPKFAEKGGNINDKTYCAGCTVPVPSLQTGKRGRSECDSGPGSLILVNPEIVSREGRYETREGCLCHEGERPVTRYRSIRVKYLDEQFHPQERTFLGFTAQIIQHEMDHFEGKLI